MNPNKSLMRNRNERALNKNKIEKYSSHTPAIKKFDLYVIKFERPHNSKSSVYKSFNTIKLREYDRYGDLDIASRGSQLIRVFLLHNVGRKIT